MNTKVAIATSLRDTIEEGGYLSDGAKIRLFAHFYTHPRILIEDCFNNIKMQIMFNDASIVSISSGGIENHYEWEDPNSIDCILEHVKDQMTTGYEKTCARDYKSDTPNLN